MYEDEGGYILLLILNLFYIWLQWLRIGILASLYRSKLIFFVIDKVIFFTYSL